MKSPRAVVALAVFWLAVLALGVRVVWVASGLETGWTSLALEWRDATLGLVLGKHEPVPTREPADQADYWLREAERIVAENPHSAEIAMGAALVLDTPATGFERRYFRWREPISGFTAPDFDYDAAERAIDKFHAKTDQQCLSLAARAAQLGPGDPNCWRSRALLQFHEDVFSADHAARNAAWQNVLDQCAGHDPDNALYDYLAASRLWHASADCLWEDSVLGYRLEVKDPQRFAQAVAHFEKGLNKTHFLTVDPTFDRGLALLRRSRVPCVEHDEVVNSRTLDFRMSMLLRDLVRWQNARAAARLEAGDTKGALMRLRQGCDLTDQYLDSNERASLDLIAQFCRRMSRVALREIVDDHPELVPQHERSEIAARDVASRVDCRVLDTADQTLGAQQATQQKPQILLITAYAPALSAIVPLVLVAGLAFLLARCLKRRQDQTPPHLGPVRHAIAWLAGCGLTFVVLGLAPAEIIPQGAQAWIAGVGLALSVISLPAWLVWRFRRRKFQFSLRALFAVTVAVALLCALVTSLPIDWSRVDQLHVPARGWEGLDAETLEQTIKTQQGEWAWVMSQWWAYSGVYVSLAVSLVLVTIWHLLRSGQATRDDCPEGTRIRWRTRLRGTLRAVSRSALGVAAICLLLDLALVPDVLHVIDAEHQRNMAYARDPEARWTSIREEVARINADPDTMRQLRSQVEQDLANEAAQEKRRLAGSETDADSTEANGEGRPTPDA